MVKQNPESISVGGATWGEKRNSKRKRIPVSNEKAAFLHCHMVVL